jgi:hypothetical protein
VIEQDRTSTVLPRDLVEQAACLLGEDEVRSVVAGLGNPQQRPFVAGPRDRLQRRRRTRSWFQVLLKLTVECCCDRSVTRSPLFVDYLGNHPAELAVVSAPVSRDEAPNEISSRHIRLLERMFELSAMLASGGKTRGCRTRTHRSHGETPEPIGEW